LINQLPTIFQSKYQNVVNFYSSSPQDEQIESLVITTDGLLGRESLTAEELSILTAIKNGGEAAVLCIIKYYKD